ncbi:MAG TPA: hypothetical protein VI136_03790 [Verrucomicrobiae bacterium]
MIHKYLIQIEDRPDTRWLISHDCLLGRLAINVRWVTDSLTDGDHPKVTVIQEEVPADNTSGKEATITV